MSDQRYMVFENESGEVIDSYNVTEQSFNSSKEFEKTSVITVVDKRHLTDSQSRIKQLEDALSVISIQTFDNECANCKEVQRHIDKALGEDKE